MKTFVLSLAAVWMLSQASIASEPCKAPPVCGESQTCGGPDHCGRCGCGATCQKYCKIVCEMKEVKKVVWQVNCSEFCPLLPGRGCGCCCEKCGGQCAEGQTCCESCGQEKCNPCASEECKAARMKTPNCGKIRTVKKLVKKEVVCKVPSYKSIVVYCCPNCGAKEDCGQPQAVPQAAGPAKKAPDSLPNPPLPPAPSLPTK